MSFSLVYFGAAARHHDGHSESRKLIVDENRRLRSNSPKFEWERSRSWLALARQAPEKVENREAGQNCQHTGLHLRPEHEHHSASLVLPFPNVNESPAERPEGNEQSRESGDDCRENRTRLIRSNRHGEHL